MQGSFGRSQMYINQYGQFLPKSGLILHQIVEISPLDVEISPPRPFFRNYTDFVANLRVTCIRTGASVFIQVHILSLSNETISKIMHYFTSELLYIEILLL